MHVHASLHYAIPTQHDARLKQRNVSCLNDITVAKCQVVAAVLKETKFFRDMTLRLHPLPGLCTTQSINGGKIKALPERQKPLTNRHGVISRNTLIFDPLLTGEIQPNQWLFLQNCNDKLN
jgi:hypothetical protein